LRLETGFLILIVVIIIIVAIGIAYRLYKTFETTGVDRARHQKYLYTLIAFGVGIGGAAFIFSIGLQPTRIEQELSLARTEHAQFGAEINETLAAVMTVVFELDVEQAVAGTMEAQQLITRTATPPP
jgi:hypothetical protein